MPAAAHRSEFACGGLAACLLLAACAHVAAPQAPIASWPEQRNALLALTDYTLNGRLAVAAAGEGFSAGISWQQQQAHSTLQLSGPLGVGSVQVKFDGRNLTVQLADGRELLGGQAGAALGEALGFDAPLSSLAYWLRGCDDPGSPSSTALDEQNRLATLRQQGWEISYENYQRLGTLWLPRQLTIRRDPVRVRLLIQRWTIS